MPTSTPARPVAHKTEAGRALDDPYLESEGRADRISGGTKQVGEQVKDAGKNIKDALDR
jgi:uncharacterized protein YjbJ (UPF0337 family)